MSLSRLSELLSDDSEISVIRHIILCIGQAHEAGLSNGTWRGHVHVPPRKERKKEITYRRKLQAKACVSASMSCNLLFNMQFMLLNNFWSTYGSSQLSFKLDLTLYEYIKTAEQLAVIQKYSDWYTGRWLVGCFGTARRGLGGLGSHPVLSSLYQM